MTVFGASRATRMWLHAGEKRGLRMVLERVRRGGHLAGGFGLFFGFASWVVYAPCFDTTWAADKANFLQETRTARSWTYTRAASEQFGTIDAVVDVGSMKDYAAMIAHGGTSTLNVDVDPRGFGSALIFRTEAKLRLRARRLSAFDLFHQSLLSDDGFTR